MQRAVALAAIAAGAFAQTYRAALSLGSPLRDRVRGGQTAYYNLTLDGPSAAGIDIYINPITGIVNGFLGYAPIFFPSAALNNDTALSGADQYLTVADGIACAGVYPCTVYVAISSPALLGSSATYTLLAMAAGVPQALSDGEPTDSSADTNYGVRFNASFWVPAGPTDVLVISTEGVTGTPDTYVKLNVYDAGSWPTPALGSYDAMVRGSGEIVISASTAVAAGCVIGNPCNVAIYVFARAASVFSITASSSVVPEQLQDGVPVASFVAQGQYRYFQFTATQSAGLQIIMTPRSGDPDLTVSATNPTPTLTDGTWVAAGMGFEIINIATSDPNYVAGGTYAIGVYGWSGNCTFSLTVLQTASGASINLIDGQQQVGQTPAGHTFSYFTYTVSSDASSLTSIDFVATPLQGDVDLYISTNGQKPAVYCATPDPTAPSGCAEYNVQAGTFQYSSVGSGVADFVTVPASTLTPEMTLIVGVLATTPDDSRMGMAAPASTFSVVGVSGNALLELPDGIAIVGAVASPGFKYYSYEFSALGSDLVITADATAGQVDVFVSDTAVNPGPGNNVWNSTARGGYLGKDVISIPWPTLRNSCWSVFVGVPCTLYISVQGAPFLAAGRTSAYTLVAAASGNPDFPYYLTNGRPITLPLAPGAASYLYASLSMSQSSSVYLVAQDFSQSGSTVMYAAIGPNATFPSARNNYRADYYSSDLGGYARIIISPPAFSAVDAAPAVAASTGNLRRLASLPEGKALYELPTAAAAAAANAVAPRADGRDNGLYAQRYGSTSAAAQDVAATRMLRGVGGSGPSTLGAGPYCNQCPLFVSLVSRSTTATSDLSFMFSAGPSFTPLTDDVATPSVVPVNGTVYFTLQVTDPLADVTITLNQFFGSVQLYGFVQSPTRPYQLPSAAFWQFSLLPSARGDRLVLPNSGLCQSADGAVMNAPCTYAFAVSSVDPSRTAYFNILATADSASSLIELNDGEQVDGAVADGGVSYYTFQPNPIGGAPVSPILITATPYVGAVQIYVTNAYIPGVSPASHLPGPGNAAICQWTTTPNNPVSILIESTDPCFSLVSGQTYTIAVVGDSGISTAGFMSRFSVSAAFNQWLAQKLEFGTPITQQFIPDDTQAVYVFDLPDLTSDVIISASVAYGEVSVAVAKHSFSGNPPQCSHSIPGAQGLCSGYTWLATGVSGASAILIPAAAPCSATSAAGLQPPLVNASSCNSDWRVGRFWVTVYAWVDAEVAVSVSLAGQPVALADGQPQLSLTTPVNICPNRDPITGACTGNTQGWQVLSAGFLRIQVPPQLAAFDGRIFVERLCSADFDFEGNCGAAVQVFVAACSAANCTAADAFPSYISGATDSAALITDAIGSVALPSPATGCGSGSGATEVDCVYAIGIYPQCASDPCPSALVRVTPAVNSAPERLPGDCATSGRSCTLPSVDVGAAPSGVRRYAAYAAQSTATVNVAVTACQGNGALYLCDGQAGSTCGTQPELPGPGNADQVSFTDKSASGVATAAVNSPAKAGPLYFGVAVDGNGLLGAATTYELTLSAGAVPQLVLPTAGAGPTPAVYRDAGGAWIAVDFAVPNLAVPGMAPYQANGVTYIAYAFPQPAPFSAASYNLAAACGVEQYFSAWATASGVASYPIMADVGAASFVNVSGTTSWMNYTVILVATCPGGCMPNQLGSQRVTYKAVVSAGVGPAPAPSPSAKPAPGPSPSNGGAIAGGVIGSLLGVALLFGGWFGYRRWKASRGEGRYGSIQNWGGSEDALVSTYAAGRQGGAESSDGAYAQL